MDAQDQDDALREMARNRGFRLVKSRRRTPGRGDFGRYGLTDARTGKQCFGFGKRGLTAKPEEVEAYLRDTADMDWKRSLKERSARSRSA